MTYKEAHKVLLEYLAILYIDGNEAIWNNIHNTAILSAMDALDKIQKIQEVVECWKEDRTITARDSFGQVVKIIYEDKKDE